MNTKQAIIALALSATAVGAGAATALAEQPETVTICHAAGLADEPANWVTLTLPWVAVYGPAGHFNENGTTQAGHEQDYLGECDVDDTTTTTTVEDTTTTTVEEEVTTTTAVEEVTTTTEAAVVVTTGAPSATPAPAPAPAPQSLPSTGAETWIMALLGGLALAGGTGLTWLTRRS